MGQARSFSIHGGMCPRCEGRGSANDIDLTQLYDEHKSLREGALTIPGYSMDGWYGRIFMGCGFFDPDKPIKKFTKKELNDLLYSACSTGSWTPASRSSSSRTTRRSWRTPIGSSTSAPAPATTAGGSSSRAHPPTSSPGGRESNPSPASTSPPTSGA